MTDLTHLDAIRDRLRREKERLARTTCQQDQEFRERLVAQAERELAAEYKFLGLGPIDGPLLDMSDDELLAELETP